MRNSFIVSVMLVAGIFCEYASANPTPTPHDLIEETVLLTIHYQDLKNPNTVNYTGSCAGVWIGTNHILSSNHCVYDERDFPSPDDNDKIVPTKLNDIQYDLPDHYKTAGVVGDLQKVAYSTDCDLVVLRTKRRAPLHPVATFRNVQLQPGEAVQSVGHPGNFAWVYIKGYVALSNKDFIPDENYNLVTINIGHGFSGGGLFDMDNNLIGTARAIVEAGDTRYAYFTNQICIKHTIDTAQEAELKTHKRW